MTATATIVSVNRSEGGIPKRPIDVATVTERGIDGDAHDHDKHNTPMQAICLIDEEDLHDLRAEGFDVFPGATGENLTVCGLNLDSLTIGARLRLSGGVVLSLIATTRMSAMAAKIRRAATASQDVA